jgi:hypothetical protein
VAEPACGPGCRVITLTLDTSAVFSGVQRQAFAAHVARAKRGADRATRDTERTALGGIHQIDRHPLDTV